MARGHRPIVRSSKRLSIWLQFNPVSTTLSAATSVAAIFSLNAAALALLPFTIVRTRFQLRLGTDQASSLETQSCAVGLATVSEQAVAVGVTALPTPVTESGSSLWFAHQYIFGEQSDKTGDVRRGSTAEMDSKAMRKVVVGQDLVVMAEGGGVGAGMIIVIGGRILIKTN